MRSISYHTKINSAQTVVENLKVNVMEIFWEEDPFEYCSSRSILPLIKEEAEHDIKGLHLKEKDQSFYLQKVGQILGEYCED